MRAYNYTAFILCNIEVGVLLQTDLMCHQWLLLKGCSRILNGESARIENLPFSVGISCIIVCANCSQMALIGSRVTK